MPEIAERLALPEQTCIEASAGCGKTEEIVKAVKIAEGRQLILTHTNSGVASLRARLRKYQVPYSKYTIDTIASWLLKYSASYPKISGLIDRRPEQGGWTQVYKAAGELLQKHFIRDVIQASYCGVFVDEYQDCTITQHNLIMMLADMLPVRVLGDPLQGIFGFIKDDPIVDWQKHILPVFRSLPTLETPWRWIGKNEELGKWLLVLRHTLENNQEIDLSKIPEIKWRKWSYKEEAHVCYDTLKESGSIVGIQLIPQDAHDSAKRLHGTYQSMEEMECRRLMFWVRKFEQLSGIELALEVINFVNECRMADNLFDDIIKLLRGKNIDGLLKLTTNNQVGLAFYKLITIGDFFGITEIIDFILWTMGAKVFRRELLVEMKRAIRAHLEGDSGTLADAAWISRYQTRIVGRKPEKRIISRTLLIKGLEFDHAIILNASKLPNKMNFYVAATRGARTLTILSENPIIRYT